MIVDNKENKLLLKNTIGMTEQEVRELLKHSLDAESARTQYEALDLNLLKFVDDCLNECE